MSELSIIEPGTKVRLRKTVRYKSGDVLVKGETYTADGEHVSKEYDNAHYRATGEHRWNDGRYVRIPSAKGHYLSIERRFVVEVES